ncbi:toxin YdaT family protein [Pectobacterium carotovorum]|uniref:toxin YdaT family protein n=1 Tax=Pectobacterium carotovorum TaxID=554 RepID=UPI00301A4602
MNIQELTNEIESWAVDAGQETVAIEITKRFFLAGGDPHIRLHEIEQHGVADWKSINNNRQQIFRWLRSDSRAAQRKIQSLAPVMLAALPGERRARLQNDRSVNYLTAVAIREFSTAMSAVLLGCCDMSQRINKATEALYALLPVTQQLVA